VAQQTTERARARHDVPLDEADVVFGVEGRQLSVRSMVWPKDLPETRRSELERDGRSRAPARYLHVLVEAVVEDQVVRQRQPVRLHRMALAIVVAADLAVMEVRHANLGHGGSESSSSGQQQRAAAAGSSSGQQQRAAAAGSSSGQRANERARGGARSFSSLAVSAWSVPRSRCCRRLLAALPCVVCTMPFVEFVVLPVISVATVVIAVAMFASPWCVRGLARARSRGRLTLFGRLGDRQQTRQMLAANSRLSQSHVPIALMFGNSVLWTVFGVASREVVMTLVNSIGVLLSSYFMLVFLLVSSPAEQRTLVIHSALALSWALGLVWYVWVRPESTQEMLEACATLGNIGVVVTIGMLASPLLDLVPNARLTLSPTPICTHVLTRHCSPACEGQGDTRAKQPLPQRPAVVHDVAQLAGVDAVWHAAAQHLRLATELHRPGAHDRAAVSHLRVPRAAWPTDDDTRRG